MTDSRDITPQQHPNLVYADALTFNFAAALPGRASSPHTRRAYFRWIDRYLVDMAEMDPTEREDRVHRMHMLPIDVLQGILTAQHLRAWLGILLMEGQGKQALGQARASIITLADLLAEADWVAYETAAALARVRPPRAEDGQRPGRWLSPFQLRQLMDAAGNIATSENQALRNDVLVSILCTMALRRDEVCNARWNDLSIQNNRMVLRVHGKGKKTAAIDVPRPVSKRLQRWRQAIIADKYPFHNNSHIIRRLWKGGTIGMEGLTTDSIWVIVNTASSFADIGHVAPHDLRRSVAGALQENGVPIDKISQLLRHSNVAVTERYLSRLPQVNEGAVLMSDVLGFDDDDNDDWFSVGME
jgi:integrase